MTDRQPLVSLLLPNRDNARVLPHVLSRLAANTSYSNIELVIVDDGSVDASRQIFRDFREHGGFPGTVHLIEKASTGAIDTLNTALHAASGEFCVQLDSDASVETGGWVEQMLGLMHLDPAVGMVTAKVVMDSGLLQSCGVNVVGPAGVHDRSSTPVEEPGRRRWHHRVHRVREGAGGAIEERVAEVDACIGCCTMYRREDALAAGGYDPGFSPVWFDDIDLCLSIRRLGRKAFYLPSVRVIHHLSTRREPQVRPRDRVADLARRVGRRLPESSRRTLEERLQIDLEGHFDRVQVARMLGHYEYWRRKWGWDFNNPDVDAIVRRWGTTEICWATDPERVAAGEAIARRYDLAVSGR